MIYYPLGTLLLAGVKKIVLVSDIANIGFFRKLFQDGSQLGIEIDYVTQEEPNGIAAAVEIVSTKYVDESMVVILGDNVFHGVGFGRNIVRKLDQNRATIFAYHVQNPQDFGVVEISSKGEILTLEEKPNAPRSHLAIPGLYVFPKDISEFSRNILINSKGEKDVIEILKRYKENQRLDVIEISRGVAWLDTGSPESLIKASNYIDALQNMQGEKIGCIEEISYIMQNINSVELRKLALEMPKNNYRDYLLSILN